jgi:hypothetical protein
MSERRYDCAVANKSLELLGKELGMFVERVADVSAHYVISDKPMSMADWITENVRPN